MTGSGAVDLILYHLDAGGVLADLLAEPCCLPPEEVEPQREAA